MQTPARIATLVLMSFAAHAGDVSQYHVVWDSPSKDHGGTMPLGNGDIGLNAWVEPSGDLLFYISKTDAWDDNSRLCKVGKVRVTLDPAPPVSPFQQTLELASGMMAVEYGDGTRLRLWVDANHPVIHVEASGPKPFTATAAVELWRTGQRTITKLEGSDVLSQKPGNPPMIIEPDTIIAGLLVNRIGWFHHNIKSVGPAEQAAVQGMTDYPREDPLLHRTFGAMITSPATVTRPDDTHLCSPAATSHHFDIHVLTRHPASPAEWQSAMDALIAVTAAKPFSERRTAHEAWWTAFWNRSWIQATTTTPTSPFRSTNSRSRSARIRTAARNSAARSAGLRTPGILAATSPSPARSVPAPARPGASSTRSAWERATGFCSMSCLATSSA
jgi:alpha-L-fucosidase 2